MHMYKTKRAQHYLWSKNKLTKFIEHNLNVYNNEKLYSKLSYLHVKWYKARAIHVERAESNILPPYVAQLKSPYSCNIKFRQDEHAINELYCFI